MNLFLYKDFILEAFGDQAEKERIGREREREEREKEAHASGKKRSLFNRAIDKAMKGSGYYDKAEELRDKVKLTTEPIQKLLPKIKSRVTKINDRIKVIDKWINYYKKSESSVWVSKDNKKSFKIKLQKMEEEKKDLLLKKEALLHPKKKA